MSNKGFEEDLVPLLRLKDRVAALQWQAAQPLIKAQQREHQRQAAIAALDGVPRRPRRDDLPFEWFYKPEVEERLGVCRELLLIIGDIENHGREIPEWIVRTKKALTAYVDAHPRHPRLIQYRAYRRTRPEFAGGFIGPLPSPDVIGRHKLNGAKLLCRPPANQVIYLESWTERVARIDREAGELEVATLARRMAEWALRYEPARKPPHPSRRRGQHLDARTRREIIEAHRLSPNTSKRRIAKQFDVDEKTVRNLLGKPIS